MGHAVTNALEIAHVGRVDDLVNAAWFESRVELDGLAHEPAARLAMGQARLVEVARALISRPRLLLLDEPAAGLRTGEKLKLVTLLHRLKRAGMSVIAAYLGA